MLSIVEVKQGGRWSAMNQIVQFDWDAVQQLEPIVVELVTKKFKNETVDLRDTISQVADVFGVTDVEAFADEKFRAAMTDGIAFAFDDKAAVELAKIFSDNCVPIMNHILDYAQGDIKAPELIRTLETMRLDNVDSIQSLLQDMLGVPDALADPIANKLGPYTVSVYCFVATYKIYEKAAKDTALAKERRIEAERLASEAIACLKAEKEEMNSLVSTYLLDRILPFGAGVAAMDQAIMENDDDGFIHANAELWQLFGRDAQYTTAEEFDDLMLSDNAFKL